ncbi:MAG: tripartite tricarboxylate transporter substrate binding protein [Proteobacteria bacterium]|nr:tripartite tricarboxylate transporter substrate binding protein [Burkholderiales bacterium]
MMRSIMRCATAFVLAASAAVGAGVPLSAGAQAYPSKPIRLILPFPPGAPSDLVGRLVGQKMSEFLGVGVVPDNRVGAGGTLALNLVAKSAADGYTILITSPTIALSPYLYTKLPFDPIKDFAPVARLATIENVMVVNPRVPVKSLKDFVTLARAQPGKLNFGSGGGGTTNHLANELLRYLEKLDIVHVPYKGATQATLAAVTGEVDQVIVSVASVLPLIQEKKVRPIVVLSEARVATIPDVPTSKEAGFPQLLMSIWYGLYVPTGTPAEAIARLNREAVRALESPDLKQRTAQLGIDPWPGTAEQLDQLTRSEIARYGTIVKSAGIKPE